MNVDWARINSFITEDDVEEVEWLKDMISTLIENYDERLSELSEVTKARDNAKLIALLHQMKGITSNFGLKTLHQVTHEAEVFAKARNLESSLTQTDRLPAIWQETKAELKSKLGI